METYRSCSQRSLYFGKSASLLSAHSTHSSPAFSWMKKDELTFTLWQIGIIWVSLKRWWRWNSGGVWANPQYQTSRTTWIFCEIHTRSDYAAYETKPISYMSWSFLAYLSPRFDLMKWLLYTFYSCFDITFQLQLCILRTLKHFCRSILYNWKDFKTFWLPQAYFSFLLIQYTAVPYCARFCKQK